MPERAEKALHLSGPQTVLVVQRRFGELVAILRRFEEADQYLSFGGDDAHRTWLGMRLHPTQPLARLAQFIEGPIDWTPLTQDEILLVAGEVERLNHPFFQALAKREAELAAALRESAPSSPTPAKPNASNGSLASLSA